MSSNGIAGGTHINRIWPIMVEALLRDLAIYGEDDPLQQVLIRLADMYRDGNTDREAWDECLRTASLESARADAGSSPRPRGLIARVGGQAAEAGLLAQTGPQGDLRYFQAVLAAQAKTIHFAGEYLENAQPSPVGLPSEAFREHSLRHGELLRAGAP